MKGHDHGGNSAQILGMEHFKREGPPLNQFIYYLLWHSPHDNKERNCPCYIYKKKGLLSLEDKAK